MFDLSLNEVLFYLFIAGILCMLIGGIVLCVIGKKWFEKSKIRLGIILISISVVAILCLVAFYICMSIALSPVYEEDIVVTSPDGEYELIIREWQAMGGSGAYVYIKDGFFKKKVDYLGFDDYSMTFKGGMYEIKWQDDCVIIKYDSGIGGENPWRSTKIELE